MSLLKKIAGALLIAFALFPFFGFPHPKELDFLGDLAVRIIIAFIGLDLLGFHIFFTKANMIAIGMFLISLGFFIPVPASLRIILFIYSLDLISFPLLNIPFFNIGRILGRIMLIILLFFLSSFQATEVLQINLGLAITLVIILTVAEILASLFLALGDIIQAGIKAAIVFGAAMFLPGFGFNLQIAILLAVGIFILNLIF